MSGRAVVIAVWVLLGAGILTLEVVARTTLRGSFPTFGDVAAKVTSAPAGRIALAIGWMWLGWHLFVR